MQLVLHPPPNSQVASQFLRVLLAIAAIAISAERASAQDVRLSESFDLISTPALPTGWSGAWATSSSSSSNGSGANNLVDTGTGAASVTTPEFDLTGAGAAILSYSARRTSSYPAEAVAVVFILPSGEYPAGNIGLPQATSSWVELSFAVPGEVLDQAGVRIRFESSGGGSSGANARIDDVTVSVSGAPPTGGVFGFGSASLDVLAGSSGVLLPLPMNWSGPDSLQGLQFSIGMSNQDATLTGIQRGSALLDLSAWTLSRESESVLLISNDSGGLSPGLFDPLLSLVFDFTDVLDTTVVTLDISGLIGALAVPDGDDAGLSASLASTTIRILPRVGVFEVADSLQLGSVQVGDTGSSSLWLFNRGTATLSIDQISTGKPAFSISPGFASIPAGDSVEVTVSFTPSTTDLGPQETLLLYDGAAQTVVTAYGQASWGDATDDGIVDVGDIVYGIDVVLGRVLPIGQVASSLDLFPFPAGDGSIDIRDLTVLTQAVLRGQWPNAIALPTTNRIVGKGGENARLVLADGILSIHTQEPMRGLQARLLVEGRGIPIGKASLHQEGDRVTLLWVRSDGTSVPPGEHALMKVAAATLIDGVVIGAQHERSGVAMALPTESDIERPFPNPFSPSRHGSLRIQSTQAVRVIDLLGRIVWMGIGDWDGTSRSGEAVAAGLYSVVVGKSRHVLIVVD